MYDIQMYAFFLLAVAGVTAIVISTARSKARRKADALGRKYAAEKITRLLESLPGSSTRDRTLTTLYALLKGPPIGDTPELTGRERWFARVAPALTALLRDAEGAGIVEWYFSFFSFPAGRQEQLLSWLATLLDESAGVPPEWLRRVTERALSSGGPAEADWLYQRALEALRRRGNDPEFKTFVLHVGRLSYAFNRPGRRLTIYDEQALANDIAMCV